MVHLLEAACSCHIGRIRANNEDNFYFNGRCLPVENKGMKHPVSMCHNLRQEVCVAVFDGMGGENYGELASFAAAEAMQRQIKLLDGFVIPEKQYLNRLCQSLNNAVVEKSKELLTTHMGSTMVALYFSNQYVYVCNLGDSRAYRLRNGEFLQISEDHVEKREGRVKTPLTQHLGVDPEEFLLEPHIAKGELQRDDQYLLCSDGLTDMLTNLEIAQIMASTQSVETCTEELIAAALKNGGRDNITVIVCRIK